jgi:hypothetical protein
MSRASRARAARHDLAFTTDAYRTLHAERIGADGAPDLER